MVTEQKREIEENFRAFEGFVASLIPAHAGEFALLHGGQLIDVYPTALDAMTEGYHRFSNGMFSIQRVVDRPVDLGFISYAGGERDIIIGTDIISHHELAFTPGGRFRFKLT